MNRPTPKTKEEIVAAIKRVKSEWLADLKYEFCQRTGLSWSDAGNTDEDAWRYYPDPVYKVVSHIIEKYDLDEANL